jgi:hypothetical protein
MTFLLPPFLQCLPATAFTKRYCLLLSIALLTAMVLAASQWRWGGLAAGHAPVQCTAKVTRAAAQAASSAHPPLILVHLGEDAALFPPYLPDTIRQALRWNPRMAVHVLVSRAFARGGSPLDALLCSPHTEDRDFWRARVTLTAVEDLPANPRLAAFRATSRLNAEWRGGFWRYAAERLFILDAALELLQVNEAFHMENDNVLYVGLAGLLPRLRQQYSGLALTGLSEDLATAGFLYINHRAALKRLLDFVLERKSGKETMEMQHLSNFAAQEPAQMGMLPVAPLAAARGNISAALRHRVGGDEGALLALGGYFDSAAHGQWLGGTDPRNGGGGAVAHYDNAQALFSVRALAYKWEVDPATGLRRPYAALAADASSGSAAENGTSIWLPIYHLHIHSKAVSLFAS